jgi:hypothetical protein
MVTRAGNFSDLVQGCSKARSAAPLPMPMRPAALYCPPRMDPFFGSREAMIAGQLALL